MAYEHLVSNTPISRDLNYRGKTEKVYFRTLTAGERIQLKKGQKGSVKAGESTFEVDLADMDIRNHLLLSFANCFEDGRPVFKNAKQVGDLPEDLIAELLKLCEDALKEAGSGN